MSKENVITAVLTFLITLAIIKFMQQLRFSGLRMGVTSQSILHHRLYRFLPTPIVEIESQSKNYLAKHLTRIIVIDDVAYWVKDNRFFSADIKEGSVVSDTTKEVDTINMSKADIDKMLFIIDKLKDDKE